MSEATRQKVVTPWDAWFAWLERERPARLYELPLADNEPEGDTKPVEAT